MQLDRRRAISFSIIGSVFILIGLMSIIISGSIAGGIGVATAIVPIILLISGIVMVSFVIYSHCQQKQNIANNTAVAIQAGYQSTAQPPPMQQPQAYPQQQGPYPPGAPPPMASQPYPPMAQQPYYPQQASYPPGPPPPQSYPPQQGPYPPQQGSYPPQQGSYPPGPGQAPPPQQTPYAPNAGPPDAPPPAYSELKQ